MSSSTSTTASVSLDIKPTLTMDTIVLEKAVRPVLSKGRKAFLLALFCLAEFMDTFIASALFPAINVICKDLDVGAAEITWAFAAYSATFAAFLLISGRVSDIYSAKWTFIVGAAIIGVFSLAAGFVNDKVALFVLRALAGIGAALTVPSALSLIIECFPEPEEQNRGISLFGAGGAVGNVAGVILGGIFVQWADWRSIFYFTGAFGIAIAILSFLTVPDSAPHAREADWRRLDLGGVSAITAAIVLFIYAVTTGSATGWTSANVLAPLFISIAMTVAFFVYEAKLDPEFAALPPRVWFYPNVGILAAVALVPFFWWCSLFFQLMPLFENTYHWSAIMTAVRFLPTGVVAFIIANLSGYYLKLASPKWILLVGFVLQFIATMLLPFADTAAKYYTHLIPAFIIGSVGSMLLYTTSNVAIFMSTPHDIAGTVGAVYNSALQLGVALGVAILASITSSTDKKRAEAGLEIGYHGIATGYWAVLAVNIIMTVMLVVFYRVERKVVVADVETAIVEAATMGESENKLHNMAEVRRSWDSAETLSLPTPAHVVRTA